MFSLSIEGANPSLAHWASPQQDCTELRLPRMADSSPKMLHSVSENSKGNLEMVRLHVLGLWTISLTLEQVAAAAQRACWRNARLSCPGRCWNFSSWHHLEIAWRQEPVVNKLSGLTRISCENVLNKRAATWSLAQRSSYSWRSLAWACMAILRENPAFSRGATRFFQPEFYILNCTQVVLHHPIKGYQYDGEHGSPMATVN